MVMGIFQRLVLSVASFAVLSSAALVPTQAGALVIEPGSTFAKGHAPTQQPFSGFVPPGSTQGVFDGSGYEEWVETLAEEPEVSQAGGRVGFTTSFQVQGSSLDPDRPVKDAVIDLPAGSVSNLLVVPPCEAAALHLTLMGKCPTETQLGVAATETSVLTTLSPVSRLIPPPGESMLFAFKSFGLTVLLFPEVRSESDFGLSVEVRDAPTGQALNGS